jgi:hypothetical protein
MNPSPELVKQVAEELKEILNAPPIMYGPTIPTCHFCGQVIQHEERALVETHKIDGETHERFRGRCCGA